MKRNFIATLFFSPRRTNACWAVTRWVELKTATTTPTAKTTRSVGLIGKPPKPNRNCALLLRDVIEISEEQPILKRAFLTGQPVAGYETKDVSWVRADGKEMTEDDWSNASIQSVGMLLFGPAADELDNAGALEVAESVTVFCSTPSSKSFTFTTAQHGTSGVWEEVLKHSRPGPWTPRAHRRRETSMRIRTILLRLLEATEQ